MSTITARIPDDLNAAASMYGLYQHPNYSTNIITTPLAK
jgi:hypothetical protein